MSAQVLVVDDEVLIRTSLRATLDQAGYQVSTAGSAAEAWQRFLADRPDVVLLDLVLGQEDGLDLLQRMKAELPETSVVVVTAHGSIQSAVGSMRLGAYDYIKKPFELEEILATIRNALRTTTLERRVEYLDDRERRRERSGGLVHASEAMKKVTEEASLVARSPVPVVLILGESGTGKQLVARLLHELSGRTAGPFVELNCSAIPENLVESELFGHERGAFSNAHQRKLGLVEIADGGTLFLDEIGDLGVAVQAKLLTFLEDRSFRRIGATNLRRVEARIVAATNRDLPAMVAAKTFRDDLWYRLNAITIRLPPLRERPDDVPVLAEHFLGQACREFKRRWSRLSVEATGILRRYPWPGNVRELRSVVSRAALMNDGEVLGPAHLPPELVAAALSAPDVGSPAEPGGERAPIPTLAEVEEAHIRRVLELCGGNRTVAAQHLGITRQTLAKKVGSASPDES